ncbi:uncharacterized protein LOC128954329 [Oppia nitens]|uniref:uncharacterized protein LOC128954329 n=1 Tax=Oppia nitens TaxID=1686743 RepID=UPI0023DA2098|nr:uncharacterized protein LOC128954329 [Oppia nitens]
MILEIDYITVPLICLAICIYIMYSSCCLSVQKARQLYCSQRTPADDINSQTKLFIYQYLITIYVAPGGVFNQTNCLYLDLYTRNQILMVSLTIPGGDIDTGNGISHVMLNKTTGLKPITFVRAIHDSRTCANRFYLQGIRVTDQQFGYSVNYLVDQYIRLEPLQTAVKHSIVRPRVDLLWTQLMRPLFWHSDRCPTKLMATPVQYPTYGFLVLPMLTLTERLMFQSYLLSLLYFYNNLLANLLSTLPLFDNICLFKVSVPVASCLAFNSTNFIAYFYRSALKSNHRSNDISQSFRQKLCSLLKSMFSLYLPVMSIILLLYPLKFDSSSSVFNNRRLFVDNQSSDESIVNLLYYMSSLVLCLTLWPLIAGLCRCLYLCLVGCPQSERFDDLVEKSINLNEMSIEKTETYTKSGLNDYYNKQNLR